MSEPMFGGGQTATQERPAEAPEAPDDGSSRKLLLILGAIVAALVVAGVAFVLLNSGSAPAEEESALVVVTPQQPAAEAPVAAPAAKPVIKPASSTSKRDPFTPLFPPKAEPANGSTSTANQPAPSTGGNPEGPATTDPNAPADPTTTVTPVTLSVSKIDVKANSASMAVDGKKYSKLLVGQSFGTYYTLYSVFNAQCVGVLYGDQSVPVCLNKPVSVTP